MLTDGGEAAPEGDTGRRDAEDQGSQHCSCRKADPFGPKGSALTVTVTRAPSDRENRRK
jgi:hypothetical protein